MTALLMMLALVIESGYLFSEKRTLQNCADAAAMAGALHLCDGDPVERARRILSQNLFPGKAVVEDASSDGDFPKNYGVEITRGYYDENDAYDDFLVYKEFVDEGEPDFPAEEYVNAVKVSLTIREALLLGNFGEKENVDVHVASVAYRRRFGLLAHGGAGASEIRTAHRWRRDQLVLENMGGIHANGDVKFIAPVEVTGTSLVTAIGKIVNCRTGKEGVAPVLDVRPIDWEHLKANATVYTVDQWPGHYGNKSEDFAVQEEHGNTLYNWGDGKRPKYVFGIGEGDHEGRIYYFSSANADENATLFLCATAKKVHYNAHNFIIASELQIDFSGSFIGSRFTMGGENEKTVYVYCKKNIGKKSEEKGSRLYYNVCKGVIFRTEKNFFARIVADENPEDLGRALYNYINVIAEGAITFYGLNSQSISNTYVLDGTFGSPCSAALLMHGRLEVTDDKTK